ncbi:hypothetical protein QUA13_31555 [Microcoleus sp. S28C3]|uniref:hypothetical protein n=1 Tax=Microcoleus sp. S28C3 TaxID=3055414 RepID=UPI002FD4334F
MTCHKSWVWGRTKIRSRCHKPHYICGTGYLWGHDICGDTISVRTRQCRVPTYPLWGHGSAVSLATGNDRPNLQSAPGIPRSIGARYNQKLIGLALRLREC